MKNNILVGIVTAIVVLVGASFVLPSQKETVQTIVEKTLAGNPGPDRDFPRECVNGVCTNYVNVAFNTASSSFAGFKTPSASSTPRVIITVTAATSTDYTLVLDEGTAPYQRPAAAATSSGSFGGIRRLAEWVVPAGTTPTFIYTATSTVSSSDKDRGIIASPGRYFIVFGDDGGVRFPEGVSSTGITGKVKAIFTEL